MGWTGLAGRLSYLWPGLLRLWYDGHVPSLFGAVAFAALLNALVLATFVYPGGPWSSWRGYGWVVLVACWMMGIWHAFRAPVPWSVHPQTREQQDLLIRAQAEYLRGHWVEAQSLLEQLLQRNPRDIEARLLLASVFRRSRRIELSRRQLRRLFDYEEASRWRFEVERELRLLDETSAPGA